jgi:hypothetical protein
MPNTFDPYHTWLGIRPEEQPPNHYRLLGLQPFEDNPDTVEHAADQRMAHLRTLQSGKHSIECQKLLNEVATAKLCLLNPEKKATYDQRLRPRLQASATGSAAAAAPGGIPPESELADSSWNDSFGQTGRVVPRTRPRVSGSGRKTNNGALVGAIVGGLMLVVVLIIWANVTGSDPAGSRPGEVAQGAKTRPGGDKSAEAGTPKEPAHSGEQPAAKAKPPGGGTDPKGKPGVTPHGKEKVRPGPIAVPPDGELTPGKEFFPGGEVKPPPVEPLKRAAVPSDAEQQKVVGHLEEVYHLSQIKAPAEKLKLAGELFELGKKSRQNPSEEFVVLSTAMDLFGEAGDAGLMLQAGDALAADFQVDALALKENALLKFAEKAGGAERIKALVESSRPVIEQAVAEKRYELALKLATAVNAACQGQAGREFRKETFARRQEIQKRYEKWQQVEKARAALESDPDDAEANLLLGRWYCCVEEDWNRGLPHLAKGSDEGLKIAAQQELKKAAPADAGEQVKRADAWYDLAEKRSGEEQAALARRAAYWYQQAVGQLASSIDRARAEKRLDEITNFLRPPEEKVAAKPAPKPPDKPSPPPAAPGEKTILAPKEIAKLFGLLRPKWTVEDDQIVGQLGNIADASNNPVLPKARRASELEFGFKIQARWYQCIHVIVDGQRYSYSRGHNAGMATVVTVAGRDEQARWFQRVASETEWCALAATLKDGTLSFYYEGNLEWSGKVQPPRVGNKHLVTVGFASNATTVHLKDFYLEMN